jgi:predicted DNA-binding transcriptional regulator AlpA
MSANIQNPFESIEVKLSSIENFLQKLKPAEQLVTKEDERFLDAKQVADLYGVSTVSIWHWEKAGLLKSYRIGNLKRYKYSELLETPRLIERLKK